MNMINFLNNTNPLIFLLVLAIIICALLVIITKNPIHSLLYLVLVFILVAILLFIFKVEFIAMLFLVVYVGAILVLFLFVVMMLNTRILEQNADLIIYIPIAAAIIVILLILIIAILKKNYSIEFSFDPSSITVDEILYNTQFLSYKFFDSFSNYDNISRLGSILYDEYAYIFFLAGLILFIAMIGSIVLALHHTIKTKKQNYYLQTVKKIIKSIRQLK